ncbi:MAG: phage tail protein [Burkholderia sp.]
MNMHDLYQYFGDDIAASATGDLQPVAGIERGQQRILRRLLTNPREVLPDGSVLPPDYIFHPEYGAGLPRKVGDTVDIPKIRALIRGQIMLEDSVARTPEPEIIVKPIQGGVSCTIRYVDAVAKAPAVLSFNVNR